MSEIERRDPGGRALSRRRMLQGVASLSAAATLGSIAAACGATATPAPATPTPTAASSTGTSLLMSVESRVAWAMRLPLGIGVAKLDRVKLQPMPKTTSAFCRNVCSCFEMPIPPEPSASGCASGKALLPGRVVITGASSSSANSRSCFQALP